LKIQQVFAGHDYTPVMRVYYHATFLDSLPCTSHGRIINCYHDRMIDAFMNAVHNLEFGFGNAFICICDLITLDMLFTCRLFPVTTSHNTPRKNLSI